MGELFIKVIEAVYNKDAIQLERAISGVESELVKNALRTITNINLISQQPLFHIASTHLGLLKVICNHLTEDHLIELLQLQDDDQLTPLHNAFLFVNVGEDGYKCLKVLLDNVRDDNALIKLLQINDNDGYTALHYRSSSEIARYTSRCLTTHQIVSLLQIQDVYGNTPLHRVVDTDSLIAWCNLLPANSLIMVLSIQNEMGHNVLHTIANLDSPYNVVDKIRPVSSAELQHLLDQKNNDGLSAIDIAMSKGHMTEYDHQHSARLIQEERTRFTNERLENQIDIIQKQGSSLKRQFSALSTKVEKLVAELDHEKKARLLVEKEVVSLRSSNDQLKQRLDEQTVKQTNHENSLSASNAAQQLINENQDAVGQNHTHEIGEQAAQITALGNWTQHNIDEISELRTSTRDQISEIKGRYE